MRRIIGAAVAALALAAGAAAQESGTRTREAIFAGGCFWCVEADFDQLPGVLETVSGYTGGDVANPTYEQVVAGGTGHREAVRITYDPGRVSYETLAEAFFRTVDPTDAGGQFCDRGFSYTTAIYATSERQHAIAEREKAKAAEALDAEIATPVEMAGPFYEAEAYHQDYYEKNPVRYKFYRWSCGRDARIEALWGAGPEETLERLG